MQGESLAMSAHSIVSTSLGEPVHPARSIPLAIELAFIARQASDATEHPEAGAAYEPQADRHGAPGVMHQRFEPKVDAAEHWAFLPGVAQQRWIARAEYVLNKLDR